MGHYKGFMAKMEAWLRPWTHLIHIWIKSDPHCPAGALLTHYCYQEKIHVAQPCMDFYSCDPLKKTPRQSTRDLSLCFFQPISPIQSRPTCKSQRAHCQGYHGSLSMPPWEGRPSADPIPSFTELQHVYHLHFKEAPILCHCEAYFSPYPLPTWVSETTQ